MSGSKHVSLAVDLGASSGRVLAGQFDGERLALHENHRFENSGVQVGNRLQWDLLGLWQSVQSGMRKAHQEFGAGIRSIGVDTWGVDFGLLGSDGELLGNPYHYRDHHTDGVMEAAFERVSRDQIFDATGLQFMPFNTLFQLYAMRRDRSSVLAAAERFLMMPDLFHWLMTGAQVNEATNASTTQFYDPRTGNWAVDLLDQLELPSNILGEIVRPGTVVGGLTTTVRDATGMNEVQVVLPGTHDTASAVMAVPVESTGEPDWCYISSGTWSLMGIETESPIINDQVRELNFTNEAGVGKTTRLLKNIAGLWLVQECRRTWQQMGQEYTFAELVKLAKAAPPLRSLIDPDHIDFLAPANMLDAMVDFCRRSDQPAPDSPGAFVRCALESLALRYRSVLNSLTEIGGHPIKTIHIVGGGTKNRLLCQMAADACGVPVISGPIEATAIGNVLVQLIALNQIESIAQARQIVSASFPVERYDPNSSDQWTDASIRFEQLSRVS